MEKRYKSLVLSDEWEVLCKAKADGLHPVPCLPIKGNLRDRWDLSGFSYVLEDADRVEESYLDRIDASLCGYPLTILKTKRCVVREICEKDLPALYEIYADPEITRYMEDLYEDPEEELAYIRDYIKWHYGLYGFGMWIIADPKGRVLGRAGFEQKEDPDFPELGFMIRRDAQGKGLAYEVCMGLMAYAAENLERAGIRSFCHTDNLASRRLLQKLHFLLQYEEGDQMCWEYRFSIGDNKKQ